jgi:hypothetical protein
MNALKIFGGLLLLLVISWFIAQWWSNHGLWWFSIFPRWAFNLIDYLAGPMLSKEAWEAEEQAEFLVFWVPSFILLTAITLPPIIVHRNKSRNAK